MTPAQTLGQGVDAVIDAAVGAGWIVGTVVLVMENGVPTYARAAGHADREAGTPTAIDTVFRYASLTKPIVAATALALMERGRLCLDDLVTDYLPDFTPRLADGCAPPITLRNLITHTAGFGYPGLAPDDPYLAADISTGLAQPGVSLEDNLKRIASVPLFFAPGSNWRYGVAMDVMGAVIASLHDGSLADAVAEYVTGPLGMSDTSFRVQEPARLAIPYADGPSAAVLMTEPHLVQDLTFSPARAFDDRSFQSAGAGMVGTAGDFMTFLEVIRTGGGPILGPETVAMASRNQIGTMRQQDSPGWGFGLLSAILTEPADALSPSLPGTLAWGGVWGNSWLVDPVAGLTIVSLSNTAMEGCTGAYPLDVRNAVYAARHASTS